MEIHQIIQNGINGDQRALRQIYDLYVDEMYSSAFRIINERYTSQDVVQESFIVSFKKLKTLDDKSNYQGWLRRIVINKSLKAIKSKMRFEAIEDRQFQIEEEDSNWYADISFDQIKAGIQQLPNGARTVFTLYALEGFTHAEIANMNGISISTSKTQYRYAKKNLKGILTKMFADEI